MESELLSTGSNEGTADEEHRIDEEQAEETPHSSLHTERTPQSSLHTERTPHSSLHTERTPHSSLHTERTPHSSLHTERTPRSSLHTEGTPQSSLQIEGTPCSSLQIEGTPHNSLQIEGTPCSGPSAAQVPNSPPGSRSNAALDLSQDGRHPSSSSPVMSSEEVMDILVSETEEQQDEDGHSSKGGNSDAILDDDDDSQWTDITDDVTDDEDGIEGDVKQGFSSTPKKFPDPGPSCSSLSDEEKLNFAFISEQLCILNEESSTVNTPNYKPLKKHLKDTPSKHKTDVKKTPRKQGAVSGSETEQRKLARKRLETTPVKKCETRVLSADDSDSCQGRLHIDENSLDDKLEQSAKRTGLTAINVKNIIHELVKNDDVQKMIRDHLTERLSDAGCLLFEPKMTRSKVKEVIEKGMQLEKWPMSPVKPMTTPKKPSILDIEFSEDEEDDEYSPDKDAEATRESDDDIESMISSQASDFGSPLPQTPSSCTLATPIQTTTPQTGGSETFRSPLSTVRGPRSTSSNIGQHYKSSMAALDENSVTSCETVSDTIARRTRSKLPLTDTSLTSLEEGFIAPDYTPDMYDTLCDDTDWQQFLRSLHKSDPSPVDPPVDDEVNDPEFNFLEEVEKVEETPEDFRFDKPFRVSKKELNELIGEQDELFPDDDEYFPQEELSSANQTEDEVGGGTKKQKGGRVAASPGKNQFELEEHQLVTTPEEKRLIEEQMRKHIQLTSQMYFLCKGSEDFEPMTITCRQLLRELDIFRCVSVSQDLSSYNVCNLQGAIDLVMEDLPWNLSVENENASSYSIDTNESIVDVGDGCKKTPKKGARHPHPLLPSQISVFWDSPVFLYPKLLPRQRLLSLEEAKEARTVFTVGEDNMIALGLEQFRHLKNHRSLIQEYLLPAKTVKQINLRIKNMVSKRAPDNLIKVYKQNKRLPVRPLVVESFSSHQIICPRDVEDISLLPNWAKRKRSKETLVERRKRRIQERSTKRRATTDNASDSDSSEEDNTEGNEKPRTLSTPTQEGAESSRKRRRCVEDTYSLLPSRIPQIPADKTIITPEGVFIPFKVLAAADISSLPSASSLQSPAKSDADCTLSPSGSQPPGLTGSLSLRTGSTGSELIVTKVIPALFSIPVNPVVISNPEVKPSTSSQSRKPRNVKPAAVKEVDKTCDDGVVADDVDDVTAGMSEHDHGVATEASCIEVENIISAGEGCCGTERVFEVEVGVQNVRQEAECYYMDMPDVSTPAAAKEEDVHDGNVHKEEDVHDGNVHKEEDVHDGNVHKEEDVHDGNVHKEEDVHDGNVHKEEDVHDGNVHTEEDVHDANVHKDDDGNVHKEENVHDGNVHGDDNVNDDGDVTLTQAAVDRDQQQQPEADSIADSSITDSSITDSVLKAPATGIEMDSAVEPCPSDYSGDVCDLQQNDDDDGCSSNLHTSNPSETCLDLSSQIHVSSEADVTSHVQSQDTTRGQAEEPASVNNVIEASPVTEVDNTHRAVSEMSADVVSCNPDVEMTISDANTEDRVVETRVKLAEHPSESKNNSSVKSDVVDMTQTQPGVTCHHVSSPSTPTTVIPGSPVSQTSPSVTCHHVSSSLTPTKSSTESPVSQMSPSATCRHVSPVTPSTRSSTVRDAEPSKVSPGQGSGAGHSECRTPPAVLKTPLEVIAALCPYYSSSRSSRSPTPQQNLLEKTPPKKTPESIFPELRPKPMFTSNETGLPKPVSPFLPKTFSKSPKRISFGNRVILPKPLSLESRESPTKRAARSLRKRAQMIFQRTSPCKILPQNEQQRMQRLHLSSLNKPAPPAKSSKSRRKQAVPVRKILRRTHKRSNSESDLSETEEAGGKKIGKPRTKTGVKRKLSDVDVRQDESDGTPSEMEDAGLSQEDSQNEDEAEDAHTADQDHLDMLMAASTTIGFGHKQSVTPEKAKGRTQKKKKERTLAMLTPDLLEMDPKKDEKDTAFAQAYLDRVRDALKADLNVYEEFLTLMNNFGKEEQSAVELYWNLSELFRGYPELLGEFAGFLLPDQAVACQCFMKNQETLQARTFLRKLEVNYERHPHHFQRIMKVLSQWYQNPQRTPEDLQTSIKPLIKGMPHLLEEFSRFFLHEKPPDANADDFETMTLTDSDFDEKASLDSFEEVEFPDDFDPYRTKRCPCDCHKDPNEVKLQKRFRHCLQCSLKVIDGKLFFQVSSKKLHPAKVIVHKAVSPPGSDVDDDQTADKENQICLGGRPTIVSPSVSHSSPARAKKIKLRISRDKAGQKRFLALSEIESSPVKLPPPDDQPSLDHSPPAASKADGDSLIVNPPVTLQAELLDGERASPGLKPVREAATPVTFSPFASLYSSASHVPSPGGDAHASVLSSGSSVYTDVQTVSSVAHFPVSGTSVFSGLGHSACVMTSKGGGFQKLSLSKNPSRPGVTNISIGAAPSSVVSECRRTALTIGSSISALSTSSVVMTTDTSAVSFCAASSPSTEGGSNRREFSFPNLMPASAVFPCDAITLNSGQSVQCGGLLSQRPFGFPNLMSGEAVSHNAITLNSGQQHSSPPSAVSSASHPQAKPTDSGTGFGMSILDILDGASIQGESSQTCMSDILAKAMKTADINKSDAEISMSMDFMNNFLASNFKFPSSRTSSPVKACNPSVVADPDTQVQSLMTLQDHLIKAGIISRELNTEQISASVTCQVELPHTVDRHSSPPVKETSVDNSSSPVEESGVDRDSSSPVEESGVDRDSSSPVEESGVDRDSSSPVEESGVDRDSSSPVEGTSVDRDSSSPVEETASCAPTQVAGCQRQEASSTMLDVEKVDASAASYQLVLCKREPSPPVVSSTSSNVSGQQDSHALDAEEKDGHHPEASGPIPSLGEQDGHDIVTGEQRGQVSMDSEQHGQVSMASEQHGQVSMDSEQHGQVSMDSEQHGQVSMDSQQHGQVSMDSEQRGQVSMDSEQHGQVSMDSEQHGQVSMDSEQHGQVSHGQVSMDSEQHCQIPMVSEQDRQVPMDSEQDGSTPVCLTTIKMEMDPASEEDVEVEWSKDMDKVCLELCQKLGTDEDTFAQIAEKLKVVTPNEVASRFEKLMQLLSGFHTEDDSDSDS